MHGLVPDGVGDVDVGQAAPDLPLLQLLVELGREAAVGGLAVGAAAAAVAAVVSVVVEVIGAVARGQGLMGWVRVATVLILEVERNYHYPRYTLLYSKHI